MADNDMYPEYILSKIREYLPDLTEDDEIRLTEREGSDGELATFIEISKPGFASFSTQLTRLNPPIESEQDADNLMREFAHNYETWYEEVTVWGKDFQDYETIRPYLRTRLCDPDVKRDFLDDKPWTPVGRLAMYYAIQLESGDPESPILAITHELLSQWDGITHEQLHRDAVEAASSAHPASLFDINDPVAQDTPLGEIIPASRNLLSRDVLTNPSIEGAYVLTNSIDYCGASVIGWDGVLEKVGQLLRQDFYVVPACVDRVMIMSMAYTKRHMQEYLDDMNCRRDPEDVLSDKLHKYSWRTKKLDCITRRR